jgi:hypothetical protein
MENLEKLIQINVKIVVRLQMVPHIVLHANHPQLVMMEHDGDMRMEHLVL